jgi:hypothetical protein
MGVVGGCRSSCCRSSCCEPKCEVVIRIDICLPCL